MKSLLVSCLEGSPFADRLVSAEEILARLRGRKSPVEMTWIEEAVRITERVFTALQQWLAVGQTEQDIHRIVHELMAERGVTAAWHAASDPAVDAGPDKPFGHGGPTTRRTKAGELLHLDFGVRFHGYCSDLQRMFFFGHEQEIPEEVDRAFHTVHDAISHAAAALRPGVRGVEIDGVARAFVKQAGYPEFQHALGHQVGQQAHDGGALIGPAWERYGTAPQRPLEQGNVFTLELGVPTEHHGAVSLEENVAITREGCRFLSHPQTKLTCVRPNGRDHGK